MRILNLETGMKETAKAVKIENAAVLKGRNKKNGWYVNWEQLFKTPGIEVYAIATGDGTHQGMVAISDDKENNAIKGEWAVVAPHNNKRISGSKKYEGVGSCLFALMAVISINRRYNGFFYGDAKNATLLSYYMKKFGAVHIPVDRPYRFFVEDCRALLEVFRE